MGSGALTFCCYKLGLIFLNILYMIVGLTLIIIPVYSKISAVFTSWPIVGGAIACGVFMMLMSIAGIYGAIKHHQIILFFYMAVMVIIFIILFSVSVAALSITSSQRKALLKRGWTSLSEQSKSELQKWGDCCGFENKTITKGQEGHPTCVKAYKFGPKTLNVWNQMDRSFSQLRCCKNETDSCVDCPTCYHNCEVGLLTIKDAVGGVGLFFSFTLLLGVGLAFRYRHLKDPRANPSAFL